MLSRKLINDSLCIFLIFLSCKSLAEPSLQGISLHRELGQDQFLGALYSDTASADVEVILDSRIAKRMELKVIARDGIVAGRFSRMWIEGAAINNSIKLLTEQANNMLIFDQMFRGRLEENDHVVIDYLPAKGVDVYLNSILLGSIASDNFFSLLLRSWIGRVPLSSRYRDELLSLNTIDSALLQRYQHLEPRLSRIAIARNWAAARAQKVLMSEIASSAPDVEADFSKMSQLPAPAAIKPAPVVAVVATVATPVAGKSVAAKSVLTEAELIKQKLSEKEFPETITHRESLAVLASQDKAREIDSEDDKPVLTTQTLLAQQMYISDALQRIYTNVVYPRRAQQLRQTGSVKIRVVIHSNGDLKDLQLLEESDFALLNYATLAAVKKAAPFPGLPESISAQDIEFSVPVKFSLGAI